MSNMPLYPQGITRDLILTVSGKTASLSEQCYIYRGDRGITLNISIQQYKYKFNKKTINNVITSDIAYARALVHKPWVVKELEENPDTDKHGHVKNGDGSCVGEYRDDYNTPDDKSDDVFHHTGYKTMDGGCFEVPVVRILNDTIEIPITADWVDELTEIGTYRLQIQLYGHRAEDHRITIPPVDFYVEEPMCELPEDFSELDQTGFAAVDYVVLRQNGKAYSADFPAGNYNKISWTTGEIITANRMNKIEDALDFTISSLANKSDKDHDHTITYRETTYDTLQVAFIMVEGHVNQVDSNIRRELGNEIEELETTLKSDIHNNTIAINTLRQDVTEEMNDLKDELEVYADQAETDAISASKKYTDDEIVKVDAKITTNTTNIAKNAENIDKNATNISVNSTSISTNATNIEKNKNRIEEVNTALDNAKTKLTEDINTVKSDLDTAKTELKNYTDTEIKELSDSLSTVATSGSYNDLLDKPFIPSKISELENDGNGEFEGEVFVSSTTCTHVEFVKEYPTEEEKRDGYLYVLIEEL